MDCGAVVLAAPQYADNARCALCWELLIFGPGGRARHSSSIATIRSNASAVNPTGNACPGGESTDAPK